MGTHNNLKFINAFTPWIAHLQLLLKSAPPATAMVAMMMNSKCFSKGCWPLKSVHTKYVIERYCPRVL